MRRADFGTLLCPEFPLRSSPRITVRGHPVQSVCFPLRKAPLRSGVYPWSTRRHCGPLVFKRATEGSRVQRRVWGRQEGAREPYGALAPFCLRRETPAIPRRQTAASLSAVSTAFLFSAGRPRQSPRRRTAAMHTPCHGEHPRPGRAFPASSGTPLYRRKVCPLLREKFFIPFLRGG